MPILESKGERAAAKWARHRGWVTYKLGGLGDKGKADRVFFHVNTTVIMEFKRAVGGRTHKLQNWHARQLKYVGHKTHYPRSMEEAIRILEHEYERNNGHFLAAQAIPRESDPTDAFAGSGGFIPRSGARED